MYKRQDESLIDETIAFGGSIKQTSRRGNMSNCELCNKQVDERQAQDFSSDFFEVSLCLSCCDKYSDDELMELMEQYNNE